MAIIDGYKLHLKWLHGDHIPAGVRRLLWCNPEDPEDEKIAAEAKGTARGGSVSWSACLPDGTRATGTAAKRKAAEDAAKDWIEKQVAARAAQRTAEER